jgi:hypothetical protein
MQRYGLFVNNKECAGEKKEAEGGDERVLRIENDLLKEEGLAE